LPRTIRILFLSANPDDTTQLKVTEECNLIDSRIQASKFRDQFHLEQRHAVSLMELQTHLLRFKPNIVHFSGHGSQKGTLIFENSDGDAEEVSTKALSALFRIINEGASGRDADDDRIHCVVLSACYSLQQAKAIAQHVDCVIGLSDAIKDKSATNFAASFYQALGFGESMHTAFELGRNQLGLREDPDEHILNLEHRSKVDPSKIFLATKVESTVDESKVKESLENEKRKKNLSDHCTKLLEESALEVGGYAVLSDVIQFDKDGQKYVIDAKGYTKYFVWQYSTHLLGHLYTSQRELFDLIIEKAKQKYIMSRLRNECDKKIRESVRTMLVSHGVKLTETGEFDPLYPSFTSLEGCLSIILTVASKGGRFFTSDESTALWYYRRSGDLEGKFSHIKFHDSDEIKQEFVSSLNDLLQNIRSQFRPLCEAEDTYDDINKSCEKGFEKFFSNVRIRAAKLSGGCQYCLSSEFHDEKEISRLRAELDELPFKKT